MTFLFTILNLFLLPIVTTGGDEDEEVDSEDEAAAAAAALTGRTTLGRATHLLADGGIVFEVHNE